MNLMATLKSFFFPYDKEIKILIQSVKKTSADMENCSLRIEKMKATLNGEEDWFLQRVSRKEDKTHGFI